MHGLPFDWIFQATPSVYMQCDIWINSTVKLTHLYRASNNNTQIVLFGGHYNQLYPDETNIMAQRCVEPFIMKAGKLAKNQPNYNGEHTKIKVLYNRKD